MTFENAQKEYLNSLQIVNHSANHISSFDYFLSEGIHRTYGDSQWFFLHKSQSGLESLKVRLAEVSYGQVNQSPFQARMTNSSYLIDIFGTLEVQTESEVSQFLRVNLGQIPLMVLSSKCMVKNSTKSKESFNEDCHEVGGFFIVNGLEKILRNIIIPKKNFPVGVVRSSFGTR